MPDSCLLWGTRFEIWGLDAECGVFAAGLLVGGGRMAEFGV